MAVAIGILGMLIGPAHAQNENLEPDPALEADHSYSEADEGMEDAPDTIIDKPDEGVGEIIVRGRRRDELLSETPISIRAFDAAEIEARALSRLDEIGFSTANLLFGSTIGSNNGARIYIRGVGQNDGRSIKDPGVGIYIDGVYLPRTAGGLLAMVDFASVEVLRGPQGTLFGKNTVGGVINIRTREPAREAGGDAKIRFGNLGLLETQVSIDLPIAIGKAKDKWFTRMTFASQSDNGFTTNIGDSELANSFTYPDSAFLAIQDGRYKASEFGGGNSGENKLLGTRLYVLGEPTDTVRIDFTFDWQQENERDRIAQCRENDPYALGRFVADNWTNFRNNCLASENSVPIRYGWANPMNKTNRQTYGTMGAVTWDALDNLAIKAIGSFRRRDTNSRGGDFDWTPSEYLAGFRTTEAYHQAFSAEINATGTAIDDRLNYTGGFYFFREEGFSDTQGMVLRNFIAGPREEEFRTMRFSGPLDFTFEFIDTLFAPVTCQTDEDAQMDPRRCTMLPDGTFVPVPGAAGPLSTGTADLNGFTTNDYATNSFAPYGQASFLVWRQLELTGGLRFTWEEKTREGGLTPFMPEKYFGTVQDGIRQKDDWSQWTPMAQISYNFEDVEPESRFLSWLSGGHFVYFQYSRGWKSGGFNEAVRTQAEEDAGLPSTFEPENSDALEVGIKSQFFDNKLSVNIAGFYTFYNDIQITSLTNRGGVTAAQITNAADARVAGFELELSGLIDPDWLPGENARIIWSGGLGYIDATYGNFTIQEVTPPNIPPNCPSLSFDDCPVPDVLEVLLEIVGEPTIVNVDFAGTNFVNTPPWNVNISATYFFEAGRLGTISIRGNYFWQDTVFFNPSNTVRADPYGLLDFRFALDNDRWLDMTVAFWMKNVLNEEYIENAIDIADGVGANQYFFGRPRSYGAEVIVRF